MGNVRIENTGRHDVRYIYVIIYVYERTMVRGDNHRVDAVWRHGGGGGVASRPWRRTVVRHRRRQ